MIPVACCLIKNETGQILLAQKANGYWEFPGGKQDPEETLFECAEREILEELGILVEAQQEEISRVTVGTATKLFELILVRCSYISGEIILHEHNDARWFDSSELADIKFCDGDKILWDRNCEFR